MALTIPYENSASISSTEYSLVAGSTSLATITNAPGIYQCWLDLSALTATEQYELLVYEAVAAGGTKRVAHREQLAGVYPNPTHVLPGLQLANGFDFTLRKVQGTDRTIAWSIRKAA
jgi:hypothetical protein